MVVAEVLLLLAGHSSSLFPVSPNTTQPPEISSEFAKLLHPGEKQALEALARVAWRYRRVKNASKSILRPSKYLSALYATLNDILRTEYEALVVETEARVVRKDDTMVASGSYVPLSSIRATFSEWDAPLAAINVLLDRLALSPDGKSTKPESLHWPPGRLIDLLLERAMSGVDRISLIMSRLAVSVQRVWRNDLTAFLVHATLTSTDPLANANASYSLFPDAIPSCVSPQTRDSIAYIGKAVTTVRSAQNQRQLPRALASEHSKLLEKVLPEDRHAFDRVIEQIRTNISEWLWSNVLTKDDVEEALESLGNYFLLRSGEFGLALIREIEYLKLSRLTARNAAKLGMIREQDLQLALLRASLGTSAQHDPTLTRLRMTLPSGPLRPLLPSLSNPNISSFRSTQVFFNDVLLGTPLTLQYAIQWPLDMLLESSDLQIYADLFSYISALRKVHTKVLECWGWLSNAQRARRKWTGLGEGGTEDSEGRQVLLRCGWGVVRDMSWFLDTLLGYIMMDVIDVEFRKLKFQLQSQRTMPAAASERPYEGTEKPLGTAEAASLNTSVSSSMQQGNTNQTTQSKLDFTTLKELHHQFLEHLLVGSMLSNPGCSTIIRTILEVCERFVAQVERWGGDVLPALLFEGSVTSGGADEVGVLVRERWNVVHGVNEALVSLLESLYDQLAASSQSVTGRGGDFSSMNMSVSFAGGASFTRRKRDGAGEAKKHVERLLLRLDFNGVLSRMRSDGHATTAGILEEGGLT